MTVLFHIGRHKRGATVFHRCAAMRISTLLGILCGLIGVVGCATKSPYQDEARLRLETLAAAQANVEFLQSLTNLPAPVQERLAPIADAHQPFSPGCTGSAPHRRFLLATKSGRSYEVALEYGGFAYGWRVEHFLMDENGAVLEPAPQASRAVPPNSVPRETWKWARSVLRSQRPRCVLTVKTDVSQEALLSLTDRVNARHGLTNYVDGWWEEGIRANRNYVGSGRIVNVCFFPRDRHVKTFKVSMYGTNGLAVKSCYIDTGETLRGHFGGDAVEETVRPKD